MDEKICLDTYLCIEIIKKNKNLLDFVDINDFPYLTSVTVFELLLRETKTDEIGYLLNSFYILDFNEDSAKIASNIHKYLKKAGTLLDLKDVFIAATCIANNCRLATLNKKHFNRIKELKLLSLN